LAEGFFQKKRELSREQEELLFDPQTSGGLLISLPSSESSRFIMELKNAIVEAAVQIGEVGARQQPCIRIV